MASYFQDVISGINKLSDLGEVWFKSGKTCFNGTLGGRPFSYPRGARSGLLDLKPSLVLGLAAITDVKLMPEVLITVRNLHWRLWEGADRFPTGMRRFKRLTMESIPIQFYCLVPTIKLFNRLRLFYQGQGPFVSEGAGHFDWIHPGTDAFSRILAVLLSEL